MKCTTTLATISSLLLSSSSVSASAIPSEQASEIIAKRVSGDCPNGTCGEATIPIVEFNAYSASECLAADYKGKYHFIKSQASPTCQPFAEPVYSVSQTFGNLKCQLTVYTTPTCSDPGQDIGAPQGPGAAPGCASDAGGFKAYKVQCPWW